MNFVHPALIIRFSTYADMEYLEKIAPFLDGIIVAANLMESTPGAPASLLIKYGGVRYYIGYRTMR